MTNTFTLINIHKTLCSATTAQPQSILSLQKQPVRLASEILTHAANSEFYEVEKDLMPARCVSSWKKVTKYHDPSCETSSVVYTPNINPFYNSHLTVGEVKSLLPVILRTNPNGVVTIPMVQRAVLPT